MPRTSARRSDSRGSPPASSGKSRAFLSETGMTRASPGPWRTTSPTTKSSSHRAARSPPRPPTPHEALLDLGGGLDAAPAAVEHHRVAVEDELVVPSHEVERRHGHAPVARVAGQHPAPQARLAFRERRRGDHDHERRAALDQRFPRVVVIQAPLSPEVLVIPEVLADGQPQPFPAERQDDAAVARLEPAPFVENVVRRQERLLREDPHAAALEQGGDVVERLADAAPVRHERSDEERGPARASREGRKSARGLAHERRALEEVPRRITADRELGKHGQIRPSLFGPGQAPENPGSVAREVPDSRVDLAKREPHGAPYERPEGSAASTGSIVVRDTRSASVRPPRPNAATSRGTPASAPVRKKPAKRSSAADSVGERPSSAQILRSASAMPGVVPQTKGARTRRTRAASRRKAASGRNAGGGKRRLRSSAPAASSTASTSAGMRRSASPAATRRANATARGPSDSAPAGAGSENIGAAGLDGS